MNKNNLNTLILFTGLIIGALMAGFSIIEKSNISNFQWAAKIEDTSIPMEKIFNSIRGTGKRQKISHHSER